MASTTLRRVLIASSLVTAALLVSDVASACTFNTDCEVGSKCLKKSGQIYGVCVGGLSPGNRNDSQPVRAPLDLNGTYGNTCSFNTDCGPGSVCVKEGGIYGTCMKRGNSSGSYTNRQTPAGCSFKTDCPIGWMCLKAAGSFNGTCVKP